MSLNLLLSVLPTIIIITIILKFDHYEKEPTALLIKLFIMGALSIIPAIIIESFLPDHTQLVSLSSIFLYALLGVGLIEEGVKFAAAKIYAYKRPSYNEIYDGIIYCTIVALGFATVENILYIFHYGTSAAVIRALTAVPAHAIFGITMGYYMSKEKVALRNKGYYAFMSIFMPVLIHGIYDFILFTEYNFGMIFFVIYIIFLYIQAIRLIRNTNNLKPFE